MLVSLDSETIQFPQHFIFKPDYLVFYFTRRECINSSRAMCLCDWLGRVSMLTIVTEDQKVLCTEESAPYIMYIKQWTRSTSYDIVAIWAGVRKVEHCVMTMVKSEQAAAVLARWNWHVVDLSMATVRTVFHSFNSALCKTPSLP